MGVSVMVFEDAPVSVTSPATLTGWSWDGFIQQASAINHAFPETELDAFYARMTAKYRSMPPLARHEHGPRGEVHPI